MISNMVSERDTERCASEEAKPRSGWIGGLTLIREGKHSL